MSNIDLSSLYPLPWRVAEEKSGKRTRWVILDATDNLVAIPAGETQDECRAVGELIVENSKTGSDS